MIWVIMGPPGAGKGTQGVRLADDMGWLHLSTGDLLRANMAAGTPHGREASAHVASGTLVPDETVIAMVAERLGAPDVRAGVLLDGFPRTVAQAVALDAMAQRLGADRPQALALFVSPEVVMERLTGRRVCRAAGHPYHVLFQPPAVPEHCDVDGSALYQRPDDTPETVLRRLEVYEAETRPVLDYYRQEGRLIEVSGEGDAASVADRLRQVVARE